ncbi:MAG: site-2 protease family protein [Bacteroidia bacterium]|nr:site-2 protease family protein [Bacteroidia bacterium]
MSRFTWHVATVGGIPIYIHWSFWLLFIWIAISSFFSPDFSWAFLMWRLLLLGGLVLSVILHELGHAFAARAFHIPTRDITMYPFGGVASLIRIPEKPLQELIVALAGPAVNVLLVGLFGGIIWLSYPAFTLSLEFLAYRGDSLPSVEVWLYSLAFMNGVLAAFNLMPAFPMDGGRVLRALLATRLSYIQATRIAALVGQGFAILFILIGVYGNPVLILVGFFVFVAASQERQYAEQRSAMQGYTVMDAVMKDFPVLSVSQTLHEAIRALLGSQARSFLVVDPLGQPAGSLSREQIIEALNEGKSSTTSLVQVMDPGLLTVPPSLPLHEGFRMLQESHKPFLVVTQNGHVIGIVDSENIAEFLLVSQAISSTR